MSHIILLKQSVQSSYLFVQWNIMRSIHGAEFAEKNKSKPHKSSKELWLFQQHFQTTRTESHAVSGHPRNSVSFCSCLDHPGIF